MNQIIIVTVGYHWHGVAEQCGKFCSLLLASVVPITDLLHDAHFLVKLFLKQWLHT
jgi:hypothetical protein